jgi:hypothetical protein
MSNWIDYDLDVLASNPDEINQIAARLNQPSLELAYWAAKRFGQPVGEVAEGLKELLAFKTVRNLGYLDNAVNKARRFSISFKDKYSGVVKSHLSEVSEAFPTAIFLVTYYDMQASYAGKWVERAGELVQQIHDGDQQAQAIDWVLLDIFAPFRAEYELGLEFGSLWQKWLADTATAVQDLKGETALRERSQASAETR